MNKYEFVVDKSQKLTTFLLSLGLKNSQVVSLYKNKDVRVDNIKKSSNEDLLPNQTITLFLKEELTKKYEIVFEDENIIIINKSAGIEVTGANSLETELNAFAVHRIDRNTKGLVIMAKNESAKEELVNAFKQNNIIKKYLCEVIGPTSFKNTLVKGYLFKDSKLSLVYVYDEPKPHTQEIKTIFTTLKSSPETSIVEATLITGKTHQIRAQLAHLNHAILGDGKYGKNEDNKKFKEQTQKLHCYYLKFKDLNGKLSYLSNKEFKLYPTWFNINKN